MWSGTQSPQRERPDLDSLKREKLLVARLRMEEALRLLDEHSTSAAAASLDLAIHQLDRELSAQ